MSQQFWTEAARWGYYVADIGASIFILMYMILARWWRTPFGRHLFAFMLVIALVFNHGIVALVWEDYRKSMYFGTVRAILYWAIAGVIYWRIGILLSVQIKKRRENRWNKTLSPKSWPKIQDSEISEAGHGDEDSLKR